MPLHGCLTHANDNINNVVFGPWHWLWDCLCHFIYSLVFGEQMKSMWEEFKKHLWLCFICMMIGVNIGKVYAYSDIATDCKVLGMFRLQNVAFGCRMSIS